MVPQTNWEMSLSSRDESWRRLRSLRAKPPALVDQTRTALFSAALEQAEQQFVAASAVGVQSRPLNLFYGLSQAGRALAAAWTPRARSPMLQGHGLRCGGLDAVSAKNSTAFPAIQIRAHGSGPTSFQVLSDLLGSAPLATPVGLGELWAMVPESTLHEPLAPGSSTVLLMMVSTWSAARTDTTVSVGGLPASFTPGDVADLVKTYPALDGMRFGRLSGSSVSQDGTETASVEFIDPSGNKSPGADYRGTRVLLPAVGSPPLTVHPLMAWWAILFTLSMLARYHPQAWTDVTDVDRSPHAVPIEYLLDVAQDAVPDLLWRSAQP